MWMSHKALKAVKHRHRKFRKYKDPGHPACKKANQQASKAIRFNDNDDDDIRVCKDLSQVIR